MLMKTLVVPLVALGVAGCTNCGPLDYRWERGCKEGGPLNDSVIDSSITWEGQDNDYKPDPPRDRDDKPEKRS